MCKKGATGLDSAMNDFTPFIVAGSPRTGSSLLLLSLSAHPQVRAFGELFHPWANPRPGAGPMEQDRFDERQEDALAFLERAVWSTATESKPVVGFKLFVSHTNSPSTHDLFRRLDKAIPSLRVLHCYRANYLDVWISLKKAEATDAWAQYPGVQSPPRLRPITASPDELTVFFEKMEKCDALLRAYHDPKRCYVVNYEKLATAYQLTLEAVWRFLGLPSFKVPPPLVKQNIAHHSEFLVNYDDLREQFKRSRFASFFHRDLNL